MVPELPADCARMVEKPKKMEIKSVVNDARWISVCMHYLPELEPDYESPSCERFKRPEGGVKIVQIVGRIGAGRRDSTLRLE
jgi:hypothetical protein